MTTARLALVLVCVLLAETAIHALRQFVDPVVSVRETAVGTAAADVYVCQTSSPPTWWTLMLAPKVLLLLYINVLAYKLREVDAEFNESRSLSAVSIMLTFLMAAGIGLKAAAEGNPTLEYVILCAGLLTAAAGTLSLVHVSKLWSMYVTHYRSRKSGVGSAASGRSKPKRGSRVTSTGAPSVAKSAASADGRNRFSSSSTASARTSGSGPASPRLTLLALSQKRRAQNAREETPVIVELPTMQPLPADGQPPAPDLACTAGAASASPLTSCLPGTSSAAASPRSP